MIDNQMKSIDNDEFHERDKIEENVSEEEDDEKTKKVERPNIFRKLLPDYQNIMNFTNTLLNCPLVLNET